MGLFQFCANDAMEPARNSSRKLRAIRPTAGLKMMAAVDHSSNSSSRLQLLHLQLPLTVDGHSP
jgi:hypothetical protein